MTLPWRSSEDNTDSSERGGRAAHRPVGVTGRQILFHLQSGRPYLEQEGRAERKVVEDQAQGAQ